MLVEFAGNARLDRELPPADQGAAAVPAARAAGRRRIRGFEHRARGRASRRSPRAMRARAGQLLRQHAAKSRARMHKAAAARSRVDHCCAPTGCGHTGVDNLPSDITVNGRTYRWMERPLVVVCVDGCQYEYITAAVAAGVGAVPRPAARRRRNLLRRRLRDAELHQSQQPVDRDRRAARRCTASAATTSSTPSAGEEVMMNDPRAPARRHDPRGVFRGRRQGRGDHREGQAAQAARPPDEGHLLLLREGRPGDAGRRTASRMCSSASACRVPSVYSAELSEFVFVAGRQADGARTARPHVPVDDRLHPAQGRARHRDRERLLRDDRPQPRAARRARRDDRADRRSRHERQARRGRPAQRHLPAGRARRLARRGARRA